MSGINVKRFVDIDIKTNVISSTVGTRDTVVLFTPDGTLGTQNLIKSLKEAEDTYSTMETTIAYLRIFFNNGGAKCLVVEGTAYSSITASTIAALDDKYILIVAAAPNVNINACCAAMKEIAITRNADATIYGVNEKLIITRTTEANDTASVKNYIVKLSTTLGAEMTVAAYLSRINVYKTDVVYDYMYTKETLGIDPSTHLPIYTQLTTDQYDTIIANNYTVDTMLADNVVNLGGNCKDGADITNTFVNIVLHQTLTDRLLKLLQQKIKNSTGLAQIYTVLAQELEEYRTAGYLATDKIWNKDDLTITYNNVEYTLITTGTPLVTGYYISVLPISSLTDADKAARKTPPIYVILADQYGIRQITVNGEVI